MWHLIIVSQAKKHIDWRVIMYNVNTVIKNQIIFLEWKSKLPLPPNSEYEILEMELIFSAVKDEDGR